MGKSHKIGTFIPFYLPNNPMVFNTLINLDFLFLQMPQHDKKTIPPFFIFSTFGFLFYWRFKQ